ncbi:MAG: DUF445 family protein [Planctomycetota bacterium]
MTWTFIMFPLIGALIGWCTNWLAVKMIFRPRGPRTILGVKVQGLLPRRQSDLATSVAQTVEQDLISVEMIQQAVQDLVQGEKVRALLHTRIDSLIEDQLASFGPMMKMFVSGDLVSKIKVKIEEEVLQFVGTLSGELHADLEQHLDIHGMVKEKIEGFDLDRLEAIVFRIASKEFRHIEILGGVLGFLVGLVQAGLLWAIEA